MDFLRLDVDGGKYTIVQPDNGGTYVLRYGEPWLSELPAGAKCWLSMAYELEEFREKQAHQYQVGDLTMERVFRATGLENLSDMQAVLDAVENALRATAPNPVREG